VLAPLLAGSVPNASENPIAVDASHDNGHILFELHVGKLVCSSFCGHWWPVMAKFECFHSLVAGIHCSQVNLEGSAANGLLQPWWWTHGNPHPHVCPGW